MVSLPSLKLKDYWYDLPEEKIAKYPLPVRDASKLLLYKQGDIQHQQFSNLPSFLPENSTLFFNNTKVIPARLLFYKQSGAAIEIFLLQPQSPSSEINAVMQAQASTSWFCMIRNLKKWKNDEVLVRKVTKDAVTYTVEVFLLDHATQLVGLKWTPELSFASLVSLLGEVPLPPYLKRKAESADQENYQTVYSEKEGAVAAPTAGLHFTDELFARLKERKIATDFLTLHVSAGTFQPIKADNIVKHPMHSEQVMLTRENLSSICQAKKIVAVGTTSMRTLESLYWFGVQLLLDKEEKFHIDKLKPYSYASEALPDKASAMKAILNYMDEQNLNSISGTTEIFIFPGYKFRLCNGLVTNFHQPGSTLILLVAAFIGEDWRRVYRQALEDNYRFLSYGDSSLLLP